MTTKQKLVIILCILGAILLLTSCATTKTIVEYRDRYITQTEVRVDSIYRDRYHTEYMRGDTVFVHDSVWLDRWHYDTRTDSVIVRDSIPYPVEVVREVRVRNAYDRFTARGFWILLAIILLASVIWLLTKTKYGKIIEVFTRFFHS